MWSDCPSYRHLMKILLVEDHAGLADISSRLLRDVYSHEVETAATGAEATVAMDRFQPELVLVDINLPDTDGFQLARQIRAQPEFEPTVLVALTGFGNAIDEREVVDAGFDASFRKPMDFEVLPRLKRVRRAG